MHIVSIAYPSPVVEPVPLMIEAPNDKMRNS